MYFDKITYQDKGIDIATLTTIITTTNILANDTYYDTYWTNSSDIINEIKSYNCPNCGAPLKIKYKGIDNCPYCDSLLNVS